MQARQLLIFVALCLIAAAVVVGTVTAYQRSHTDVRVDTPAVNVEAGKSNGETTVDAPFAHVEKDKEGTKVEAPGVKIEIPKAPSD